MNPTNTPAPVQLSETSLLRSQLVAAQGAINALSQQLAYADMQIAELKAKADASAPKEKTPAK